MTSKFNLSKLGIDGKELGILYHQSSVKEAVRLLKESLKDYRNPDIDRVYKNINKIFGEEISGEIK